MEHSRTVIVTGGPPDVAAPYVSAFDEWDLTAVAKSVRECLERLEGDTPAAVVCLAGGDREPTPVHAAVRERHGTVPVVLVGVDPNSVDLFSDRTATLQADAEVDAVVDEVDRLVAARPDGALTRPGVYTTVEQASKLRELLSVTRELQAAETVQEICEVAVEAGQEILDLPAVGVYLVDEDAPAASGERTADPGHGEGEMLSPVAVSPDVYEIMDGSVPSYTRDDPTVWDVYEFGESRVYDDIQAAPEVARETPVRSVIILPLGGHGVLISSSLEAREFTSADVDLARLLAANTAAALDEAEHRVALRERGRELREERDRLTALFQNVPIPAVRVDHVREVPTVREVNAAFEDVFGYTEREIVDEYLGEFVVPADSEIGLASAREVITDAVDRGTLTRVVRRQTTEGLRDFLLTVAIVDPEGADDQAYAFYIDITERKQRQQRLMVLSRILRHDIRNRMNVIEGHATLAASAAESAEVRESLSEIQDASGELLGLSRRTRVVERTVAQSTDERTVDLVEIVTAAVSQLRDSYPGVTVDVTTPESAVLQTTGRLAIVAEELLSNAVEHHHDDEPWVGVTVERTGDGLALSIEDDGPGVPVQERELVTGEREVTQLDHGSGIGLWTVAWIVTSMGGDLSIEDREPRGTTVSVWLPPTYRD